MSPPSPLPRPLCGITTSLSPLTLPASLGLNAVLLLRRVVFLSLNAVRLRSLRRALLLVLRGVSLRLAPARVELGQLLRDNVLASNLPSQRLDFLADPIATVVGYSLEAGGGVEVAAVLQEKGGDGSSEDFLLSVVLVQRAHVMSRVPGFAGWHIGARVVGGRLGSRIGG